MIVLSSVMHRPGSHIYLLLLSLISDGSFGSRCRFRRNGYGGTARRQTERLRASVLAGAIGGEATTREDLDFRFYRSAPSVKTTTTMERRIAALPPPSASLQRRCWPHRGTHTGAPASLAVPLLTISNPVFSTVVVTEPRHYNWLLLWIGAPHFFLIMSMLFSLPHLLAANAADTSGLLIIIVLCSSTACSPTRWPLSKKRAFSRVQQRLISEHGSAGPLETMRSPTATTIRRRTFGRAWRPSSQDRSRDCLRATHDQWRSRGLRLDIYAMMCGSCVCAVAVKSAVIYRVFMVGT